LFATDHLSGAGDTGIASDLLGLGERRGSHYGGHEHPAQDVSISFHDLFGLDS
jgi:hypothetical protein